MTVRKVSTSGTRGIGDGIAAGGTWADWGSLCAHLAFALSIQVPRH